MTPLNTRTKATRGRLHLRLATREIAEIQQAAKSFGATTPATFFLQLIRQHHQTETLALQIERQLQGIVEIAVGTAVAQLGDRLAADLSVISTALTTLAVALDERPTKGQLSAFIDHVRGKPPGAGGSFSASASTSYPGATVTP